MPAATRLPPLRFHAPCRRAPAAPRPCRPCRLLLLAGAALLADGCGGGNDEDGAVVCGRTFNDAVEMVSPDLPVEKRRYVEADTLVHQILARKELAKLEIYKRAVVFERDFHEVARQELEAQRVVPAWLKTVAGMTEARKEGADLFKEGERLAARFPNTTLKPKIDAALNRLRQIAILGPGNEDAETYPGTAEEAGTLRRNRDYAAAVRLWKKFLARAEDPLYVRKATEQLARVNAEALARLERLTRQADELKAVGKREEARRLLEVEAPKLKGTDAEGGLAALIKSLG